MYWRRERAWLYWIGKSVKRYRDGKVSAGRVTCECNALTRFVCFSHQGVVEFDEHGEGYGCGRVGCERVAYDADGRSGDVGSHMESERPMFGGRQHLVCPSVEIIYSSLPAHLFALARFVVRGVCGARGEIIYPNVVDLALGNGTFPPDRAWGFETR